MSREDSYWFRLRNFHNAVKFKLLESVVTIYRQNNIDNLSLLDVSVGKGGDYSKWKQLDLNRVIGLDPSKSSIQEANNRLKTDRSQFQKRVTYHYTDPETTAITADWTHERPRMGQTLFDIVSCQMTLHYFFENESMLENAIKNISDSLLPGGFFVGTVFSGSRLFLAIKNREFDNFKEFVDFELKRNVRGVGRVPAYSLTWKDISKNYMKHDSLEADPKLNLETEFLVNEELFVETCKRYNLVLQNVKPFADWYSELADKPIKLWKRHKPMKMQEHEQFISFLYDSFVFRKEVDVMEN